ncbi:MAG: tRNA (N6-threonylcarbamoyladenosine(37)-N6)-methyltransferase TrmO [Ruminococcaceae bacterium]|nr:tRNA (N6-threonylcarbamoyladenosine(37)-N6)-methyltransferase TrmO [Oscillospiraceae bacterium]
MILSERKLEIIGYINTPFRDKFGIPRQSGMAEDIISTITFTQKFRNPDALRGLEGFSHIWVLWEFSEFKREKWSPTVRPPRLGGNKRMGVFATRSPNRPNSIGLSCLKLVKIVTDNANGPVITVSGADMLNGTPIFDIKPYIPFTDSRPEALSGFTEEYKDYKLKVEFSTDLKNLVNENELDAIVEILSLDPRPSYQNSKDRIYGVSLFDYNIKFTVDNGTLTVCDIEKENKNHFKLGEINNEN